MKPVGLSKIFNKVSKPAQANCKIAKSLTKTQNMSGGSRQSLKVFGSRRMRSL